MAYIDTHKIVKELVASGLKAEQAEVITRAINHGSDDLVTKKDLEIALAQLKIDLLKWIFPMFLTVIVLIVGLWLR